MTAPHAADAVVPAPPKASVWEDFIDIFYAPSDVFERRRDGRWGLALLVLTIVVSLLYWLSQTYLGPMYDAEFDRQVQQQMQNNPQMTPEMAEQMRGFQRFGVVFVLFGTPIAVVVVGLVLWLVGKLFDSTQTLGLALVVSTYAQFPRIIDWIVRNAQGAMLSPEAVEPKYGVSLSLARFLDQSAVSPVAYELASRVDVFTLWVTALLAIGLHITGGISKGRAFAAAAIVWVIGALPVVLGALASR